MSEVEWKAPYINDDEFNEAHKKGWEVGLRMFPSLREDAFKLDNFARGYARAIIKRPE